MIQIWLVTCPSGGKHLMHGQNISQVMFPILLDFWTCPAGGLADLRSGSARAPTDRNMSGLCPAMPYQSPQTRRSTLLFTISPCHSKSPCEALVRPGASSESEGEEALTSLNLLSAQKNTHISWTSPQSPPTPGRAKTSTRPDP